MLTHLTVEATVPQRKRKSARRDLASNESVLTRVSFQLRPDQDGELRADGFREPHPSIRLPGRLLIPAVVVAQRLSEEVSFSLDAAEYVSSKPSPSVSGPHPAIRKVLGRVCSDSSVSDGQRPELASWTHKYAPSSIAEVLQPAREMTVLKDWLASLTVTSIEKAAKLESQPTSRAGLKPRKRKRRRRRSEDLDGFLVDSDDDVPAMDELTDGDSCSSGPSRQTAKSIVQAASDGVKLSNAVLISGPHGCGKSAAAHAVARELGFQVFEINSCERRSGKDVLDKIGNMTENHIVRHHGTDIPPTDLTPPDEANTRNGEDFQRDLASGRQGKMKTFFQLKSNAAPKGGSPKKKPAKVRRSPPTGVQRTPKKASPDQQQSVIVVEEVDILFKEDKDFWAIIMKLIANSKRPFILTCNDEDLVPLQTLNLHAILRLTPPPATLATDYMLSLAAADGHLLARQAVADLYEVKGHDLRASITDLQFWCQRGVGDPRSGLSWIYQRYPPGSDLDSQGRRLRVISQGTYQSGMGLVPKSELRMDEQLVWAGLEHGVSPSRLMGWHELSSNNVGTSLKAFSHLADSMSATDLFATAEPLDHTQKPLGNQLRSHYIDGLALLQTDHFPDFTGLPDALRATQSDLAFTAAGLDRPELHPHKLKPPPSETPMPRSAFASLDPLAAGPAPSSQQVLTTSALDAPLAQLATDTAPYIRSIARYDLALIEALSGSGGARRARTTRSARSALEGGNRSAVRRQRWFGPHLDLHAVLETAGSGWAQAVGLVLAQHGADAAGPPATGESKSAVTSD